MLSYGSQASLSQGQAPWTLASFWPLRGSMVLSRAPHPKSDKQLGSLSWGGRDTGNW